MRTKNRINRKSDVQTHREGYGSTSYPALDVKVHNDFPSTDRVVAEFGCDEATADKALQFAWESAQGQFWEQIEESAQYIFGGHVKVYSQGRSSGWLIVQGLYDIESWDAVVLNKWRKFAKLVDGDIDYRCSWETVSDAIEANEWARPGAELYNFIDTPSGPKCVADLNAHVAKARAEFLEASDEFDAKMAETKKEFA